MGGAFRYCRKTFLVCFTPIIAVVFQQLLLPPRRHFYECAISPYQSEDGNAALYASSDLQLDDISPSSIKHVAEASLTSTSDADRNGNDDPPSHSSFASAQASPRCSWAQAELVETALSNPTLAIIPFCVPRPRK